MDAAALRDLLVAHPAVAIQPFGTRRGVLCVRVQDAARLVADAGLEVSEDELEAAMVELGGSRLRLVDPAAGPAGPARAAGRRGRAKPAAPRRARKGPPLEDLDVFELPAAVFGG